MSLVPSYAARRYDIVRDSLRLIEPKADGIGAVFYELLLAKHPSLSPLFARTDLHQQGRQLMQTIGWTVAHLQEPGELRARLAELGDRHRAYGVKPEHYDLVGECLLGALERELGSAFDDRLRQAWAEVYLIVAEAMQETISIPPSV
ncbi:MAG: globin domain-containing protein [Aquabacterium sp.]